MFAHPSPGGHVEGAFREVFCFVRAAAIRNPAIADRWLLLSPYGYTNAGPFQPPREWAGISGSGLPP